MSVDVKEPHPKNLLSILKDHTAGDPMRQDVKWTNLSRRQIARKLNETDTPAGKNVVSQLLKAQGFHRRKPQKKRTMKQHVDRNEQFEIIARLKKECFDSGKPVLSIDTKKKEELGNYYRSGITDAVEPTIVNDHDFPSYGHGKLIPHGIYDIKNNAACLHLNTSCDTSELACDSVELWWKKQGKFAYPDQDEITILCDCGGSNSANSYLFKEDLQALADRLKMKIRIAHLPAYCSKYNPIEHLVFPHVTRACQGGVEWS
ncbi:MAG: ISAzo13 family transposase [Candidatus Thioglobus sp.]|nr:MAG: ISAzo13 family transposase [Candidatus Thioglobus sp.]